MSDSNLGLIKLADYPSMAAPWSTEGEGEGWDWGDFLITIQKKPKTVAEVLAKVVGEEPPLIAMTYHYSATVYYKPEKNISGQLMRPVIVAGLEEMDVKKLAILMDGVLNNVNDMPSDMPIVVGLFTSTLRMNLGNYSGRLILDDCRSKLFETIKSRLKLEGYPNKIGDISFVYKILGPKVVAKSTGSGCLGMLGFIILVPSLIALSINYFI